MKKYYIGLLVLAMLTIGLTAFTVTQGLKGRQDKITERRAQEIAEKLNQYVSNNQKIPESLSEVGVGDVPQTIRYTKKDDTSYEFCATYRQASNSDLPDIGSILSGTSFMALSGLPYQDYGSLYDDKPDSLYLPYTHTKGDNCQTVTPYLYTPAEDFSSFDDYNSYCESADELTKTSETYELLCGSQPLEVQPFEPTNIN